MVPPDAPVERSDLRSQSEDAAAHPAALHQLGEDPTGGVDRNREAEPLGAEDHRGIDADYARVAVNQGTTAVAGVERNVALDDGVHQPTVLRPQSAAERADHAGADGEGETERVADRHHQLADAQFAAAAQLGRRQVRSIDVDHGEVGRGIGSDHVAVVGGPVVKPDLHGAGAADHMGVREQVPVGGEQHKETLTTAGPTASTTEVTACE